MKRTLLFLAFLVIGVVAFGQTEPNPEPDPIFTWDNFFDALAWSITFLVGIVAGRWRIFLQFLSTIIPALRDLVDQLDEWAAMNISNNLEKRQRRRGKDPTLSVKKLSAFLVLFCVSFSLFAQNPYVDPPVVSNPDSEFEDSQIQPASNPASYPKENSAIRFSFVDHTGQAHELSDGDTVRFEFQFVDITKADDTSSSPPFRPIFAADTGTVYNVVSKYGHGLVTGQYITTSGVQKGVGYMNPDYYFGAYYFLSLRTPTDGRFIRFFITTNEDLSIDTATVYSINPVDLDQIMKTVDTIRIEVGQILNAETETVSIVAVMELELGKLTVEQLRKKYFKSKSITVEGVLLSTCDFADYAGIACWRSEQAIFESAKQKHSES